MKSERTGGVKNWILKSFKLFGDCCDWLKNEFGNEALFQRVKAGIGEGSFNIINKKKSSKLSKRLCQVGGSIKQQGI